MAIVASRQRGVFPTHRDSTSLAPSLAIFPAPFPSLFPFQLRLFTSIHPLPLSFPLVVNFNFLVSRTNFLKQFGRRLLLLFPFFIFSFFRRVYSFCQDQNRQSFCSLNRIQNDCLFVSLCDIQSSQLDFPVSCEQNLINATFISYLRKMAIFLVEILMSLKTPNSWSCRLSDTIEIFLINLKLPISKTEKKNIRFSFSTRKRDIKFLTKIRIF